jgi:hypothetical protein
LGQASNGCGVDYCSEGDNDIVVEWFDFVDAGCVFERVCESASVCDPCGVGKMYEVFVAFDD